MPALRVAGFDGLSPRTAVTKLADNQAQVADNVKLYSQELRAWRRPVLAQRINGLAAKTIFHLFSGPAPLWLAWDKEVDVVNGPLADVTEGRFYYTGDGVPKKSNYTLSAAVQGAPPVAWLRMGVAAPTVAPLVSAPATTDADADTRTYVYTFVSQFGSVFEESAPSPPSTLVTVGTGDTVTITGMAAPPTDHYNIVKRRIYRSVTGATTTTYQFVTEMDVAQATFLDALSVQYLGEDLVTVGWNEPPDGLMGLVAMPNGAFAGFVDNTIYFSDPYHPHAWPLSYAITLPYKVVGLGLFGSALLACTTQFPYIIDGATPGLLSVELVQLPEPCISKRSIVSDDTGVIYASPNGLVEIGPSIRAVTTRGLFRRDEWQAFDPVSLRCVVFDGHYVGLYVAGDTSRKALVLTQGDTPALSRLTIAGAAAYVDDTTGAFFYVSVADGHIYQYDGDDTSLQTYEWRSKRFVSAHAVSFSVIGVEADYTKLASGAPYTALTVEIYDGETGGLLATITPTNHAPVRLPPFKVYQIEVRITGNVPAQSVTMATTVQELLGG